MTTITQTPYLMTDLGQSTLYTMRNKNGMQVSATDFGGHLVSILALHPVFAQPQFSTDNAMGVAVLTKRLTEE